MIRMSKIQQENKYDFLLLKGKILSYLKRNKDKKPAIYSKDIEKEFSIKKSFISTLLKDLENSGLIYREPEGKRKKIIISEKGLDTIKKNMYILCSDEEKQVLEAVKLIFISEETN